MPVTSTWAISASNDAHHEKTDLKVFVVVIPKEGWARVAAPILLLVWHRLFRIWVFWLHRSYSLKVGVIPFFWYDNDKDLKVCFLVTCVTWVEVTLLRPSDISTLVHCMQEDHASIWWNPPDLFQWIMTMYYSFAIHSCRKPPILSDLNGVKNTIFSVPFFGIKVIHWPTWLLPPCFPAKFGMDT